MLRDNRESGPYTLKELKAKGLRPLDLIWVEGESTSWKYPSEIKELKGSVKAVEKKDVSLSKSFTTTIKDTPASGTEQQKITGTAPVPMATFQPTMPQDVYTTLSYEELKIYFEQRGSKKIRKRRQLNISSILVSLTVVLLSVVMIAVMVKKAVDDFDDEPVVAAAGVHEIINENLPVSTAPHAAKTIDPVIQNAGTLAIKTPKQHVHVNAIIGDPTFSITSAPTRENTIEIPIPEEPDKIVTVKTDIPENEAKEEKKLKEEKELKEDEKPVKPVSKPTLQLVANDYKVGLLGGIKNLELILTNPSTQVVDKAAVQVEYLRPNGKIAHAQNFEVFDIAPGASKKIVVPDNSRGVSIRYRVTKIDAHGAKIAIKNM